MARGWAAGRRERRAGVRPNGGPRSRSTRRSFGGCSRPVPGACRGTVRPFAEGWDNALWLVDETIAFRFPAARIAIPGVEHEIRVLPGSRAGAAADPGARFIGGHRTLRLAVLRGAAAAGRRAGAEGAGIGAVRRWGGARPLPARAARTGAAGDPRRRPARGPDGPRATCRRACPGRASGWRRSRRPGCGRRRRKPRRIVAEALRLKRPDGLALVHGDLHVRHVLVSAGGVPSAVIDWGDLCIGDPSIDLSLYWSLLDAPGRAAFRAAYGGADLTPARLLRARLLALFLNAALALYADDPATGPCSARRSRASSGRSSTTDPAWRRECRPCPLAASRRPRLVKLMCRHQPTMATGLDSRTDVVVYYNKAHGGTGCR